MTRKRSFVARLGFFLALASALAGLLSGAGSRWGLWNFHTGFGVLLWSAYGGLIAATVSLIGIVVTVAGKRMKRDIIWAVLGLCLGAVVVLVPLSWSRAARTAPSISDITTDTVHPPKFAKILPLRKGAPNPSEYGGPVVAQSQIEAYPDILPLLFDDPPVRVFDKALAVARSMDWRIIDANRKEGRIEAVAHTFWFHFEDDIVIRIEKSGQRTRLDIRSVSRVGKNDMGTNAERIRKFLKAMAKRQ
jgi:uncharacterized protein (DUF1499 family)